MSCVSTASATPGPVNRVCADVFDSIEASRLDPWFLKF